MRLTQLGVLPRVQVFGRLTNKLFFSAGAVNCSSKKERVLYTTFFPNAMRGGRYS
jgi:hypothetical protein